MKNILNLVVFAVLAVFTQVASAHGVSNSSQIYGWWQVQTPLVDDGFVYSTGQIYFDENNITFQATCSFRGGLNMTAQVSSPLQYNFDFFNILQNQEGVTRSGNASCVAKLIAGPVEYNIQDLNHMEIFNRNTGFYMELVK